MGYNMVVYMATISGIDSQMYEAALIDGASKWQQTKYITIPTLRPIISIMFIMAVGNIFRSDFGLFYQATRNSGSLTSITQTIDVYVYKALLERPNINLSSAAALLQSVCGCLTIVVANIVVKRSTPKPACFKTERRTAPWPSRKKPSGTTTSSCTICAYIPLPMWFSA